jgi:hypothetical protein
MLAQKFEIHDLGQVKYFLGLLVERDRAARTITISAALKIQELLVKYGQEDAHPAPTPMTKDFMQTRCKEQGDPWSSGTIRQYNPLSGPCCWTLHEEDSL